MAISKQEFSLRINSALVEGKKEVVFRTTFQTGTGRFAKFSVCQKNNVINHCDDWGLSYREGNDAPKGGRIGDYIAVKIDKRVMSIKKSLQTIENEYSLFKRFEDIKRKRHSSGLTDKQTVKIIKDYARLSNLYMNRYRKELIMEGDE